MKDNNQFLKNINWKDVRTNLGKWFMANFIGILTLIATIWIGKAAYELTTRNQAIVLKDIELNNDNEKHYLANLIVSQGKIKKAYLASFIDNGIIYTELNASLNNIEIDKQNIDIHEVTPLDLEDGVNDLQDLADKCNAQINDIVEFGLVFLDYANQWSFYYIIIRPGFVFSDLEYTYHRASLDGTTKTVTALGDYSVDDKVLIIDTVLVNKETLKKKLDTFDARSVTVSDNNAQFTEKNEKDGTIELVNITTGIASIALYVPYTVKNSDELFNTISSIKNDLH